MSVAWQSPHEFIDERTAIQGRFIWRIPALGRGKARHFCRHKSTQKGCHQKCFFAHKAFTPQSGQNHGLLNLTSTAFAHSLTSIRFANAPATAQSTIVLPAFARSLSAAGEKKSKIKKLVISNEVRGEILYAG